MKYALIGCGRVAPNHIRAALNNHLEFVGLCDQDIDKAAALREASQLPDSIPLFQSHQELLEKAKPELVAIATWSGEHAKIALDAIRAGVNVIVEKPIALSLEDADLLIREAREHHVKLCANHQNRFNPVIVEMRRALEAGKLGRMLYGTAHVRWKRTKAYYEQDDAWRGTWAQDGGALMNQCIHNADLLRWMMGDEIQEVIAYTDNLNHPYIEVEDLGLALIRFTNGTYGLFEGTTNVSPDGLEETLYLFGDRGTVKAGGMSVNHLEVWQIPGEEDRLPLLQKTINEDPLNVYGHGHTPLYADMIEAIEKDRAPLVDGEAGRRALELILGIYRSAKEKRPVAFPLESGSTMESLGRFQ